MPHRIRMLAAELGISDGQLRLFAREIAPDDCIRRELRGIEDLSYGQQLALLERLYAIESRDAVAA